MPKRLTTNQLNEFALEIFDVLSNIKVEYITKILELALEKRLKLEDDPRVKFPKWITEELALYKDDGETLDYKAGTKVYEIWTKGQ